jgi:hypothetical protein
MISRIFSLIIFTATVLFTNAQHVLNKPRVVVLTDIENEPDDAMSMVRFLTYSNQFDVEGLIATTSVHQKNRVAAWRIKEIVEAYGRVRDNLEKHEKGFPSTEYLLSIIKEAKADYGLKAIGDTADSPGSELLVKSLKKNDKRPLWVLVWGGPNCLAQALWRIKKESSRKEVKKIISNVRVYAISDQDDSGPWIRKVFPELFYIASPGFHSYGGYHNATWTGISGDRFHGRFSGAKVSIVDNAWLDLNVRNKGALGKQYPQFKFLMEGDTPSFLYLINNGLGHSEHPDWGSWGGRYDLYQPRFEKWFLAPETRPLWTNAQDEVLGIDSFWHTNNKATIWRWREAFQNDFAARMDWTIKSYAEANHPPIVKLNNALEITAKAGERINLSAEGSSDPDGDTVSYKWFYYSEPGSFTISTARTGEPLKIENSEKANAYFVVPTKYGRLGTMHIILAVTDNGKPALTRYQRVIITVVP